MQGMTPDERDAYLKKVAETEPNVANAIGEHADEKLQKRESKNAAPQKENMATEEVAQGDDRFGDLDGPDSNPAELVAQAESSSFAESVMADTQGAVSNSNIAKPSQAPQDVTIDNSTVAPVTPKGPEF